MAPESAQEGAVDEEVDGGTEELEDDAQFDDQVAYRRTSLLAVRPGNLDDLGWNVSDDEDQNDGNHYQCDILFTRLSCLATSVNE